MQTTGAGLAVGNLSALAAQEKHNVLLIHVDQHRACDVGYAGNDIVQTPNLDRLAREGAAFQNAIANISVCTPSRAVLLTGKYPLSNGCLANDLALPTGQNTIASVLKENGYKTGYIGKWHLDGIPRGKFTPPGPRRQRFDDFWAVYNCRHSYFNTQYYLDTPTLIKREGYEPDVQTELARGFFHEHQENPFFLMISYGPPHAPYEQVPEKYKNLYGTNNLPLRKNCKVAPKDKIAGYYAHITAIDDCVGRLMKDLETLGLREKTMVVFTSDHGDMLWSHGRIKKQQPWEESINVPLIINQPGKIPSGKMHDVLIGTPDLTVTLLNLLHAQAPSEMEGLNYAPYLLTGNGEEHESVPLMDLVPTNQTRHWNGKTWRGVRTKRYTYARWENLGWVLYDNQEDPYQLNNLIDKSEYAELRQSLEEELQKWLKRLNDPFCPVEQLLAQTNVADEWQRRGEHFDEVRGR